MSLPRGPKAAKLVMSLLYRDEDVLAAVLGAADQKYGPLDFLSETLAFDFTTVFTNRKWERTEAAPGRFSPLIPPEHLPAVKLWANSQENLHLNEKGGRKINIRPGIPVLRQIYPRHPQGLQPSDLSEGRHLRRFDLDVSERIFHDPSLDLSGLRLVPSDRSVTLIRRRYLWQRKNPRPRSEEVSGA